MEITLSAINTKKAEMSTRVKMAQKQEEIGSRTKLSIINAYCDVQDQHYGYRRCSAEFGGSVEDLLTNVGMVEQDQRE